MSVQTTDQSARQRLDKWLWHARFFKTRSLAAKMVAGGHVRVNTSKVHKTAHAVGSGDVLTFPQGARIRVVRILGLAARRGPAVEAQSLYEDLTPAPEPEVSRTGGARPTKRDRRAIDALRDG